jgi:hypothetical protein
MKNPNQALQHEGAAELQAKMAIRKIRKMIEEKYPVMSSVSKARLIMECLIEVSEERKYLAAQ